MALEIAERDEAGNLVLEYVAEAQGRRVDVMVGRMHNQSICQVWSAIETPFPVPGLGSLDRSHGLTPEHGTSALLLVTQHPLRSSTLKKRRALPNASSMFSCRRGIRRV